MKKISFHEALAQILTEDNRYQAEAYIFIREALDFASKLMKKPAKGPQRHVSAAELLEAVRQYALREYGPLAMTVLNYWGVNTCADFGQIVFNLVNKNILRKTENDSIHDFDNGYDFETAFRGPYQSARKCRMKNAQASPEAPPRRAE
jgi:uncharacterized repeat protein (TIGR04138 family)